MTLWTTQIKEIRKQEGFWFLQIILIIGHKQKDNNACVVKQRHMKNTIMVNLNPKAVVEELQKEEDAEEGETNLISAALDI